MTGLVLRLAPHERILINGAVLANGPKRSKLNILTPETHILRLRDAIHPDEAATPVSRACFTLQMVLAGEITLSDARPAIEHSLTDLLRAFRDPESRTMLRDAETAIRQDQPYPALRALRSLLELESRLLAPPTQ